MSSPLPEVRATARPNGLIDTIQAGFNAVNRNLWILLVPLALDLALWLGPQLTLGQVIHQSLIQLTPPPGATTEAMRSMEELRVDSLRAIERDPNALNRYNLVSLLSIPGLGVPAFHSGFPGHPGQGPQAPLPSISAATAAAMLCLLCGSLLSALYYGMLGQAVRDGRTTPTSFAPDFAPILAWTVALFVLIVVLIGAVFIPFGMLLAATHAAPALTALLVPVFAGFVLWILIYLVFTSAAVYVNRVPPLVAVRQSIQVVRSNFWSTLGLILLIVLIGSGLQTLWEELAVNLPGIGAAAAIVGHIYIASGLSAASMIYYKERFERLAVA